MNVSDKLRLIQEGYSIADINSGDVSPFKHIQESSVPEFLFINPDYITETSIDLLHESSGGFLSYIAKFFRWIRDKISQFIKFIKSKFSSNRKSDELKTKVNQQLSHIQGMEFKLKDAVRSVNYEAQLHVNTFDKGDYDFFGNGIKKVYDVLDDRIKKMINIEPTDSKIVAFADVSINDEGKFLDSVFNEVFKTNYTEENLIEKLYGPKKKVIIWAKDLIPLIERLHHMEDEQKKIVEHVGKTIPKELSVYESTINVRIGYVLDAIEEAKKVGNYKIVNEQNKKLHDYRTKIQNLTKIYNYMFNISTKFMEIHATMLFKLSDAIKQVMDDMSGKIKLPTSNE